MGDSPKNYTLASLIEVESCIHLKHSRCWDPASELKNSREQGVGLGQITRAYTPTGQLRFDALSELKVKHYRELYDLTWNNIKFRPDLQIRAIVLKSKDNYQEFYRFTDDPLAFSDAAYNGGLKGVNNERRACTLIKGCNPRLWFGHVEKVCLKSKAPLYGNRSACTINRDHVNDVLKIRATKYISLFN